MSVGGGDEERDLGARGGRGEECLPDVTLRVPRELLL